MGGVDALPALDLDPLALFQVLVVLEEVLDAGRVFGRQVFVGLDVAVRGYSFSIGTASSLASPPDSSSISSTPMARQRTTAPIWIGNGVSTSTSAGSPSSDRVCGM
ncbi:hypothetical protein AXXA_18852 [Achromobacter insuavis AXX-A]|uniref:Uncharacterized protein n=1 Tax=Achromobacter insuavis AXX-A TaxID=1003200 RepID=F7T4A0_9BURK|nr:hypothetical protein AXXA_18852 [Achromobacter insuavis AXX-A]